MEEATEFSSKSPSDSHNLLLSDNFRWKVFIRETELWQQHQAKWIFEGNGKILVTAGLSEDETAVHHWWPPVSGVLVSVLCSLLWCDNCYHHPSPSGGWWVAASELVSVVTGAWRVETDCAGVTPHSTPALIVVDRTGPGEDRRSSDHDQPRHHSPSHCHCRCHCRSLNFSQAPVSIFLWQIFREKVSI